MARIPFPDDLLLAQIRVTRAYAALAQQRSACGTTALRNQLLQGLRELHSHSYWTESGHSHAALVELRREARARAWAIAV